jgi:hypothetical protein
LPIIVSMPSTSPRVPSSPVTPSSEGSRAATDRSPTSCDAPSSAHQYLNLTEAAARDGNDRRQRFRCARAECNEAAAALEAAVALGLACDDQANPVLSDLDRLAAMLTRLGGFGE